MKEICWDEEEGEHGRLFRKDDSDVRFQWWPQLFTEIRWESREGDSQQTEHWGFQSENKDNENKKILTSGRKTMVMEGVVCDLTSGGKIVVMEDAVCEESEFCRLFRVLRIYQYEISVWNISFNLSWDSVSSFFSFLCFKSKHLD